MSRPLLAVWALVATFGILTLVTYTRLPPEELYNVSRDGIGGGLSRTLVYLNFPVAFVAIGVLLVCLERLRGAWAWVAGAGIVLCAVAAWPGVLDQHDLDARWINAVPALGVVVAALATLVAPAGAARPIGMVRPALAVGFALLSIPWFFAEAGFFGPDPILADEVPAGEEEAAVHLGGHHGTYGLILLLAALALSLAARRAVTTAVLALLLAYGAALALEDFWHEQIEKRGTVDWTFPSVLEPKLNAGWLGILVAAVAVELLWFRRERLSRPAPAPR
jgi:hypothetical protein